MSWFRIFSSFSLLAPPWLSAVHSCIRMLQGALMSNQNPNIYGVLCHRMFRAETSATNIEHANTENKSSSAAVSFFLLLCRTSHASAGRIIKLQTNQIKKEVINPKGQTVITRGHQLHKRVENGVISSRGSGQLSFSEKGKMTQNQPDSFSLLPPVTTCDIYCPPPAEWQNCHRAFVCSRSFCCLIGSALERLSGFFFLFFFC